MPNFWQSTRPKQKSWWPQQTKIQPLSTLTKTATQSSIQPTTKGWWPETPFISPPGPPATPPGGEGIVPPGGIPPYDRPGGGGGGGACTEGSFKCIGSLAYLCISGQWAQTLDPRYTSQCQGPATCTEGNNKCEGYDKYTCINSEWVLTEANSPSCGYTPPTPPECTTDADCPDGYVCSGGICVEEQPPTGECETDFDCPEGQVCVGGICQTAPEGPQEGDTQCVGEDLWTFQGGQWVMTEAGSEECIWDPNTFSLPPGMPMYSAQWWNRMVPSEQLGYRSMLEHAGMHWPDVEAWQKRIWPQWDMPTAPRWQPSYWW